MRLRRLLVWSVLGNAIGGAVCVAGSSTRMSARTRQDEVRAPWHGTGEPRGGYRARPFQGLISNDEATDKAASEPP